MRGRAPRDHCALVFALDGGGARMLPTMSRPTRRYDGYPAAIALWFSTKVVRADTFLDAYCHVRRRT
eukprot:8704345-Pyramimonas_sp.AAC.1